MHILTLQYAFLNFTCFYENKTTRLCDRSSFFCYYKQLTLLSVSWKKGMNCLNVVEGGAHPYLRLCNAELPKGFLLRYILFLLALQPIVGLYFATL